MTDLKRAEQTCAALYWAVVTNQRAKMSPHICEAAVKMHELWKREVNILKAAEKDAEPKHDLVLERLTALEMRFDLHAHNTNGATGPPT